jgi:prolyl-tRNA synthetase
MKLAEGFYTELKERGFDVIIDDRNERPGFKFKDSELIGIPLRVAIGEKSLANGVVELKRRDGELEKVAPGVAVARTVELAEAMQAELSA